METPQSGTDSAASTGVPATASDSSIEGFLSSIADGSIADGVPTNDRPAEQLANESGEVIPDEPEVPVQKLEEFVETPSIHNQKVKPEVESRPQPEVPKGIIPGAKQSRDLSMFPAEVHNHLRQMSGPAFDWVKQQHAEQLAIQQKHAELETRAAEAEKARDQWLYSHEEAYKLAPEYKQQESVVNRLGQEEGYWRNALTALEEGQPIRDLLLGEDGKLRVGEQDIPPSPQVKAQVLANLSRAAQLRTNHEGKLQEWTKGHNTRLNEFRTRLDNIPKQLFPNGVPDALKPLVDKTTQMFPPELRGQKEYQLLAMANALIGGLGEENKQLKAQLAGKTALRQTVKKQGPGDGAPAGEATSNGSANESVDSFMKRMRSEVLA